jgi:hypothetical protein
MFLYFTVHIMFGTVLYDVVAVLNVYQICCHLFSHPRLAKCVARMVDWTGKVQRIKLICTLNAG